MTASFPHSPAGHMVLRDIRVAIRFFAITAGWITFAVVGGISGVLDPFWGEGKGLVILITGIQILIAESVLYIFLLNWSIHVPKAPRKVQGAVLYATAFIGGASLFFIFVELSRLAASIPFLAVGDGTMILGASLLGTPVAAAILTASLTRIGIYLVQRMAKENDA